MSCGIRPFAIGAVLLLGSCAEPSATIVGISKWLLQSQFKIFVPTEAG